MFGPPVVAERVIDRMEPRKERAETPTIPPNPSILHQRELKARVRAGEASKKEKVELQRLFHTSHLQRRKHGRAPGGVYGRLLAKGRKLRRENEKGPPSGQVYT